MDYVSDVMDFLAIDARQTSVSCDLGVSATFRFKGSMGGGRYLKRCFDSMRFVSIRSYY